MITLGDENDGNKRKRGFFAISTSERNFVLWKEETRVPEIEPGLVAVRVAHEDPGIVFLTTEFATEIRCTGGKVVGVVKLKVMDFVNGLAI